MFKLLNLKGIGVGILLIIALIAGVKLYISYQINRGISRGLELASLQEKLSLQNKAIEARALSLSSYLQALPQIKERVITKYQVIQSKDSSCESQLKEVKNALDLFYNNSAHPPDST